MIEHIKRISNPLTIVAIFAALAELSGTVALGLVEKQLQPQFIWFVMLFPVFLVTLFFTTLNFNPKVLYSPGDFADESNFMSMLKLSRDAKRSLEEVLQSIEQDEHELNERFGKSIQRGAIVKKPSEDIDEIQKISLRHARGNVAVQMDKLTLNEADIEEHIREMRFNQGYNLQDANDA